MISELLCCTSSSGSRCCVGSFARCVWCVGSIVVSWVGDLYYYSAEADPGQPAHNNKNEDKLDDLLCQVDRYYGGP